MKNVGILTLPHNTNWGGMIQSVALSHALGMVGYNGVLLRRKTNLTKLKHVIHNALKLIPYQNINQVRYRDKVQEFHLKFLRKTIPLITPEIRSEQDMRDSVSKYDLKAVIVGSDQVWRMKYIPTGCVGNFFLDFVGNSKARKISYAASFGSDRWESEAEKERVSKLINDFDSVSVREQSGVRICAESFGYDKAINVLDPTLLPESSFYRDLAAPSQKDGGKVVLSYLLDEQPVHDEIRNLLGDAYASRTLSSKSIDTIDLPHWLRAFIDADFVVTDSFHGTVFSIIFEKQFVSIVNHERGADRFYSLLSQLSLENRMVEGDDTARSSDLVDNPIDYAKVGKVIAELRTKSFAFLEQALAGA